MSIIAYITVNICYLHHQLDDNLHLRGHGLDFQRWTYLVTVEDF